MDPTTKSRERNDSCAPIGHFQGEGLARRPRAAKLALDGPLIEKEYPHAPAGGRPAKAFGLDVADAPQRLATHGLANRPTNPQAKLERALLERLARREMRARQLERQPEPQLPGKAAVQLSRRFLSSLGSTKSSGLNTNRSTRLPASSASTISSTSSTDTRP